MGVQLPEIGALNPLEEIQASMEPFDILFPLVKDSVVILDTYTYNA